MVLNRNANCVALSINQVILKGDRVNLAVGDYSNADSCWCRKMFIIKHQHLRPCLLAIVNNIFRAGLTKNFIDIDLALGSIALIISHYLIQPDFASGRYQSTYGSHFTKKPRRIRTPVLLNQLKRD